jgi:hypothetical protein
VRPEKFECCDLCPIAATHLLDIGTVSSIGMSLLFLGVEFLGLCGQEKNIRFTEVKMERREALSIPGAKRSRNGSESEHGALFFFAPHGAAQAGLTEGAERSSKTRHETNVKSKDQPKGPNWRAAEAFFRP